MEAAADVVVVSNVFSIAKDEVANVATARRPVNTTFDVSTANAADNAPPPDVVSVAKAVVAAGVAPPAANTAVPDVFAVAKNEFPGVAAAIKPVTTSNVMSTADNVATVSPEDDATAPETLAAATVAPPRA